MKPINLCKLILLLTVCGALAATQIGRAGAGRAPASAAPALRQPPAPVIGPNIPTQVAFGPGVTTPETARPFFDYFSWQSFAALVWPAAIGDDGNPVRGVPNTSPGIGVGSPGTRVWETYKADWELFRPDGAAPTKWSSWDLPAGASNPCGDSNDGADRPLVMVSKMDSVVDGLNQAFSGPLVDQNRNYVRYDIRVNKPFYEKVVEEQWYLRAKQGALNVFPDGVIELKAAWKQLAEGDDPGRFYTVKAKVVQPGATPQRCVEVQMALIGFHIANKTARFREWVWSTFEHVDNVPEGTPTPGRRYSLNNGTGSPSTAPNGFAPPKPSPLPDDRPLPPADSPARNPVQVGRLTPISPSGQVAPTTDDLNRQWQQALAGTVWENYKLVVTQWPTVPNGEGFNPNGSYPAASGSPFPVSKVANTTMETYLQRSSCMACHFQAAKDDFSFLLSMRAFEPPPAPPNASFAALLEARTKSRLQSSTPLQRLSRLLTEIDQQNNQAARESRPPAPPRGRARGRGRQP